VVSAGKRSVQHGAIRDSRLSDTWRVRSAQPHSNVDPKALRYQACRQARVAYVPLNVYDCELCLLGSDIHC
jgi:hypothetical protein